MGPRRFWGAVLSSAVVMLSVSAGCQLIFPFDRSKIDSDGGAGGTTVVGGGGTTSGSTTSGSTTSSDTTDPCFNDNECPAPPEECQVAKCDMASGMCGQTAAENGTPTVTQTVGDCLKGVCQNGVPSTQPDATDVLDDGNPCTDDICDANNEPKSAPSSMGTACNVNGGKLCDGAGNCVACLQDGDCVEPTKPVCDPAHACIPAVCQNGVKDGDETATDCGGTMCAPCADGLACNKSSDCGSLVCTGNLCQVPTCGDGVKNGDETDIDCGATCGANKLCGASKGCNTNADCKGNQCTGMAGTCVPNCADKQKNNVETDVDCGGGTCMGCPVGGPCAQDNDCALGNCVDGVCCDTACLGTCRACNIGGSVGTCSNIANGWDPAGECTGDAGCDGAGACMPYAQGTPCSIASECSTGFCVDGFCCNNACTGFCNSCSGQWNLTGNGTCGEIYCLNPQNECAGASFCTKGGCSNICL